jgi:hypothetical protein
VLITKYRSFAITRYARVKRGFPKRGTVLTISIREESYFYFDGPPQGRRSIGLAGSAGCDVELSCVAGGWGSQDRCGGGGRRGGGARPLLVLGLKQVHPRYTMDRLRGVRTSQDRRPEELTKASESAMAVMD